MLNQTERVLVLNVVTVSYSGSTWAALLLGSHSQAFCVGEIDQLIKQHKRFGRHVCSLHGETCSFWQQYDPHNGENPYLQLARLSGRRVLVVTNARTTLAAQRHPNIDSRYLFIVRDGRAVVASSLRKYPEQSTWDACRFWAKSIARRHRVIRRAPREHVLRAHYEHMLRQPEPYLQRVCGMAGLPYEPQMLQFQQCDHHYLGGSIGTLSFVAKTQQMQQVLDRGRRRVELDASYYNQADAQQFKDERWLKELSDRQLRLFALRAGFTNRRYGYGPSRLRSSDLPRPFADEPAMQVDVQLPPGIAVPSAGQPPASSRWGTRLFKRGQPHLQTPSSPASPGDRSPSLAPADPPDCRDQSSPL